MILRRQIAYKLCIALCLLIPFLLSEISPTLQPYPAILLPSGANTIYIEDNQVSFNRIELIAVLPDRSEQLLDPTVLFAPIPQQYWPHIARLNFGLGAEKTKSISFGHWTLMVRTRRAATDTEHAETIRWLRMQLARLGLADAVALNVRASLLTYDIVEQTEVKRETIWENYLELEI